MRLRCPNCGFAERFAVQVISWVDVDQDGVQEFDPEDALYAEPHNDLLALTICRLCAHQGTLREFSPEGTP